MAKRQRSEEMQLSLYFDGSCSPNPGMGGCGAVVYRIKGKELKTEVLRESCCLGEAMSSNVAEYSGLILGLLAIVRKLRDPRDLSACRPSEIDVNVYGDSELVVKQMTGEYTVRDRRLEILYSAAKGLVDRFSRVRFYHIRREGNTVADGLAQRAQRGDSTSGKNEKLIFYPNRCGYTRARIGDLRVNASDDRGASMRMPHILVDAAFLASLPSYGIECLQSLSASPYQMCSKASLVLGVLSNRSIDLSILEFDCPDKVKRRCKVSDAIVVHNLPVPLHISYDHPAIGGPFGMVGFSDPLSTDVFPREYAEHPYWMPNKIHIPSFIGLSETVVDY